jgi:O-antigen ligase
MVIRQKSGKSSKSWPFIVLCVFIVFVFLTGGSSRSDVSSLAILRPVSVLVCFYAAWLLTWDRVKEFKFFIILAAACFAIAGIHLIPLPPSVWQSLPGRELIANIDQEIGLGDIWRPMNVDPASGWNALYSLFVPLAALLLGIAISQQERLKLLPLFIGLGLFTGLLGLLQASTGTGALDFYRIGNKGFAVGLFANRNHQAVFLAVIFPMLAVYCCAGVKSPEQSRFRIWIATIIGLVLIPLLLVTGSRAGLITGFFGLVSVPFLYRAPKFEMAPKRKTAKRRYYYIGGAFAVFSVGLLSILLSRAEAVNRLFNNDVADDARAKFFVPIVDMSWKYFPFGSGMGSFSTTFKIDEPAETLSPQYINRAHNDYLELFLTGGVPAILLLVVVFCALALTGWRLWQSRSEKRNDLLIARAALVISIIFILASIADYPLRMPSLMCFAVIIGLWMAGSNPKISQNP